MGAIIGAWLLGWLGGQQGCRCQQKYAAVKYGRICFDAANAGRDTGRDTGCTTGVFLAGQRRLTYSSAACAGGPGPPRNQSLPLRIVALALGLVFFALGLGLGSHLVRSRFFTVTFLGFGFLAGRLGRLGGLVLVCRTLA